MPEADLVLGGSESTDEDNIEELSLRLEIALASTIHEPINGYDKTLGPCIMWSTCNMNDMPSQDLAPLVETRASTFTAFRNGYGLRREYSLKMRYGLREYPLKMRYGFREYYLKP